MVVVTTSRKCRDCGSSRFSVAGNGEIVNVRCRICERFVGAVERYKLAKYVVRGNIKPPPSQKPKPKTKVKLLPTGGVTEAFLSEFP